MEKKKRGRPAKIKQPEPEKKDNTNLDSDIQEIESNINSEAVTIDTGGLMLADTVTEPEPITSEPAIEKRGRKKKAIEPDSLDSETLEIFFSETLGKLTLNAYIKKILSSKTEAENSEVEAFTNSVRGILKKYVPASAKEHAELANFILVMTSVTLSRIEFKKKEVKIEKSDG